LYSFKGSTQHNSTNNITNTTNNTVNNTTTNQTNKLNYISASQAIEIAKSAAAYYPITEPASQPPS